MLKQRSRAGQVWKRWSALLASGACFLALGCSQAESAGDNPEEFKRAQEALTITEPDLEINSQFGLFVSADQQTAVIGDHAAYGTNPQGHPAGRGQAHIYTRTGGIENWAPLQVLLPDGPTASEVHFGERSVLHNNLLLVSAHRESLASVQDSFENGAVYVYRRPGTGQPYTRIAKFVAPTQTNNERFGYALATDGNFIAVGAGPDTMAGEPRVYIYALEGDNVVFKYSITTNGKPRELAITQSGSLVVLPAGPDVLAYHLGPASATPLQDTALFGANTYSKVVSSGNSVALLDPGNGGRVVVATLDTARVTSATTVDVAPDRTGIASIAYRENQHILISYNDTARPGVLKFDRVGNTWAFAGSLYPPVNSRFSSGQFGSGLASASDFVLVGDMSDPGHAYILGLGTNSPLDGAVYDQQQLLARDACGAQCAGESFTATNFGRATAIGGDVAAVTATEQVTPSARQPSVHIYERQGNSWQHEAQFFLDGKRPRAVAVENDRVFVGQGSLPDPTAFYTDGSIRVYEKNANQEWTLADTITADDDGSFSSLYIGDSIAVQGDTLVAGSFHFVYVFQRNGDGTWSQVRKHAVDSSFTSSIGFAHAVSLTDAHLLIGARFDNQFLSKTGSAFVYRRSDWGLEQKLQPTAFAVENVEFGAAVDIHGDTLMVGTSGVNGGNVEVWERTGSGTTPWERSTSLRPRNGDTFRVGTTLSLEEDRALIGAPLDTLTGPQGGAAYLVRRVNGVFSMEGAHTLIPRDNGRGGGPLFGWGVDLDGDRAIVGAPPTDVDFFDSGAAYIFEGLIDEDGDGLLATDDCNDQDGIAVRCSLRVANLSFEPAPAPAWVAQTGSYTFDNSVRTDGQSALRLGAGNVRLRGPAFSSGELREVGTRLGLDVYRGASNSDAVTFFMSAPAFGLYESVVGTVDLSALPVGAWSTVSVPLSSQQRAILLDQTTEVRFHLFFNAGGPNLRIDRLHFEGLFLTRVPSSPALVTFSASLAITSDWGSGYCASLRLSNAGTTATAGWNVMVDKGNSTLTSNWNAAFSSSGSQLTIHSNQAWNSGVAAGAVNYDPSVGFCANRSSGTALPVVVSASAL